MTQWTYLWADEAAHRLLGDTPETMMDQATEVKSNPVRRVLRSHALYFKFDSRRAPWRARREWRSFQLLRAAKLPVVDYLACGESAAGTLLITRELPESESVATYFFRRFERDGEDPTRFLAHYAAFVKRFLESGFHHPDFHGGNILISQKTDEFCLVDVYGVRRSAFCDRLFRRYSMERIGMELRTYLDRATVIRFLAACGVAQPEPFYRAALRKEAAMLRREWPKRRRQILAGYPKFTYNEGNLLRAVDPLRDPLPLEHCECRPAPTAELEQLLAAHFFLQLAAIPHRRVAAIDRTAGKLYLEPVPSPLPASATPDSYRERLRLWDIDDRPEEWGADRFGRPVFCNLYRLGKLVSE